MEKLKCNHSWIEQNNYLVCELCNKQTLKLNNTGVEGIKTGMRKDGKKYKVRDSRLRYFFPDEWLAFMKEIKEDNKLIFETLIMTGARIDEALHIKVKHFRWDRKYLTLFVTKIKAKKRETKPTPRDISLSSEYIRKVKKHIADNKLKDDDYLFISTNDDTNIKKACKSKSTSVYNLFKRALVRANIKDYEQFSLHNIRKTHGMWLKSMGVSMEEICLRLGHNVDTYLKHYGSTDVFQRNDKLSMIKILGDVYNLK